MKVKIALAMIVKGDDKEAALLNRCLGSLVSHVDAIYITSTYKKGELPNAMVEKVAKSYNAKVSQFEWVSDFAQARNFNFSQVDELYTHIMWCDADDMIRGAHLIRDAIEKVQHTTEAFGMWYLYDFDEHKLPTVVHKKTMIIKNDGCARWVGALHEDLEPTRIINTAMIEGVERLHLTDNDRVIENAKRNLAIAKHEAELKPSDPRSYWNLANSYFATNKHREAEEAFKKFIEESESEDEKYIAYQRLSDVYNQLGERKKSVETLQYAIGFMPTLPDAYHQLGFRYLEHNNLEKAEHYCIQGMLRKPDPNRMIVFNPRDYDYNPMMMLAKVYYLQNKPHLMLPLLKGCLKIYPNDDRLKKLVSEGQEDKDKLEKALYAVKDLQSVTDKVELRKKLDLLPEDIQAHPAVAVLRNTNFVKEVSSGKDLIIYCGMTGHVWNAETFKTKGVGGSEEAVIHLAREYTLRGYNVTVYNNCGARKVVTDGVTYAPYWLWNYRDKQDITILWRWAKPLDVDINSTRVYIDLHDVMPQGEFTKERIARVDRIFVKTYFHRRLLPNVPDHKIEIIPNGMDISSLRGKNKKDPYLLINTSSPDRSLDVLPKLFKRVKERVPQARLQWAYGWDIFDNSYANDEKKQAWKRGVEREMQEAGIEVLGRLSQGQVAKLYQKASVLAYPTEFAEIDCISVKKAQSAYCYPVTTNFGALDESVIFGSKVKSEKGDFDWNKPYQFHFGIESEEVQNAWVDACVEALESNASAQMKRDVVNMWSTNFGWDKIAVRWLRILEE